MSPVRLMNNFTFSISYLALIDHWSLIIDNSLPGLRSRSYFGGVGKTDNCKLIITSEEGLG